MPYLNKKIKIIFIGASSFGVPALKALIQDDQFDIIAIITQPDKKAGRKQIITPSPVKKEAIKNNIPVLQPVKISDAISEILNFKPDIIIVAAYAQIIPQSILNIPQYGCVNIHGSLLPKYRGASCVQAAVLNGDKETGVTIMKMDAGLDTGPVLAQKSVKILAGDTSGALYTKLADLGAESLIMTLKSYIAGELRPIEQDSSSSNLVKELKKEDGRIDWEKPAVEIERFIRAMSPWPNAFASFKIKNKISKIKIIETELQVLNINNFEAGNFFLYKNKLAAQCGQNALIIKRLQLEGKKEISAEEFLRGYKNYIGSQIV